jgi:hypothetical protein
MFFSSVDKKPLISHATLGKLQGLSAALCLSVKSSGGRCLIKAVITIYTTRMTLVFPTVQEVP